MALRMSQKKECYFMLTSIDKSSMYVKTDVFTQAKNLMKMLDSTNVELIQVNVETKREPIAFSSGFFVSAQRINKEAVSERHNKLWEILK